MDPNQQEIFHLTLDYLKEQKYVDLAIYVAVLYVPFVPVVIHNLFTNRKISQLYKDRLTDKDAEIERQAGRIKELENAMLKTRRR